MNLFTKADTQENKVLSLISLAKNVTGKWPTKEELFKGAEKMGITVDDDLVNLVKSKFPEIEL